MGKSETSDGLGLVRMTICTISGLLLWVACGAAVQGAGTGSLEEKLETVTDYEPKAIAPVDQLVEVAQRFKIPMGIERVERVTIATKALPSRTRSVRELIDEIASASPELRIEVADGLVRIYSPTEAVHPFNFLNIRLKSYVVKDADLFAAEDQLRWAIRFTLEPERYLNGYAGGYGHGSNEIFQIPKFSFSGSNITVREILNRIAIAQGNALWVATIKSGDLEADEPCWNRKGADCGALPVTSAWRFFPLAQIAELAKEHVAIDVMIAGLLDQRMTTIPVMLEHGLAENPGGATAGSSSEGSSYSYAASIEEIGKDFVKVSIHLQAERRGEIKFNFEEKLQVYKDRVTEVRPEPQISIRAYFECAAKP